MDTSLQGSEGKGATAQAVAPFVLAVRENCPGNEIECWRRHCEWPDCNALDFAPGGIRWEAYAAKCAGVLP